MTIFIHYKRDHTIVIIVFILFVIIVMIVIEIILIVTVVIILIMMMMSNRDHLNCLLTSPVSLGGSDSPKSIGRED